MTASEAKGYGALLEAVQGHIAQLFDLLERKSSYYQRRPGIDCYQIYLPRRKNAFG